MHWQALYSDGTTFEGLYKELDRSRLAGFCLLRDEEQILRVPVEAGQRLHYRRRTTIRASDGGQAVWHLVGLEPSGLRVFTSDGGEAVFFTERDSGAPFHEAELAEEEL